MFFHYLHVINATMNNMKKNTIAFISFLVATRITFSSAEEFKKALLNPNIWNQKKEFFTQQINYKNLLPRVLNFENLIIIGIDFSGMPLSWVTFKRCQFISCNFSGTNLQNSEFSNCNFYNSIFEDIIEVGQKEKKYTDFSTSILIGTEFHRSKFGENTKLKNVLLTLDLAFDSTKSHIQLIEQYAEFIKNKQIEKAIGLNRVLGPLCLQLQGSVLNKFGTNLSGIKLENADLTGAYWSNIILEKVTFKNVDLTNAHFVHTIIQDAELENVNITKTNFMFTYFRNSTLSHPIFHIHNQRDRPIFIGVKMKNIFIALSSRLDLNQLSFTEEQTKNLFFLN